MPLPNYRSTASFSPCPSIMQSVAGSLPLKPCVMTIHQLLARSRSFNHTSIAIACVSEGGRRVSLGVLVGSSSAQPRSSDEGRSEGRRRRGTSRKVICNRYMYGFWTGSCMYAPTRAHAGAS
ncbi:hypothetical protein BDA96_03G039400 [Sorghum bicolor]|uniref:Uncharacterized protein n=2 Tax=Sorghum bicolor TaxID=4558 RepID=A0A921R9B6_SORBI|nr:hypothetical protein BDA96_03G039400 [Sorghum bicolor]KXG31652.1 hypothetical protein SORBI_3003G036100 [Sorghum bicolor]